MPSQKGNEPMTPPENGWNRYEKLVLKEIEDLNSISEKLREEIGAVRRDIVGLKVRAGVWGLAGGFIPVAIGILVLIMRSMV